MNARRDLIEVQHAGRKYCGAFRIDGALVHVESAYGSRAGDLGRRGANAEVVARRLMLELLQGRASLA